MDKNNNYGNIGNRIAFYRRCKGLTQRELAEKAGISLSYLGKIEAANVNIHGSLNSLYSIAAALSILPAHLLMPVSEGFLD